MEYINHINKYADSAAIQAALDEGTLVNPYVAFDEDSGALDFNSLEPTPPAPSTMGTWSDDGEGNYTFQITETDTSYWEDNPNYIGQLASVIFHGSTTDMDITLGYDSGMGGWLLKFNDNSGETNIPEHTFYDNGEPETWDDAGVQVAEGDSDAYAIVEWDGSSSFTIYSGSSAHPVSISTYDPEYPAGE